MRQRGFTLIELTVVIVVLMLFASVVVPNLSAQKAGRERRAFLESARRIALDARSEAIERGATVTLRYEEGQKEMKLEREAAEQNEEAEEIRTVALPEDFSLQNFRVGKESVTAGDWQVRFFADGTSDGGAVELDENGDIQSLIVDKRGNATLESGSLPEETDERWPVGDYERRA